MFGFSVKVSLRVYLFCLLRFCQACCCWDLGGKIDTAYILLLFCCFQVGETAVSPSFCCIFVKVVKLNLPSFL